MPHTFQPAQCRGQASIAHELSAHNSARMADPLAHAISFASKERP
jgi:hypothetical protein